MRPIEIDFKSSLTRAIGKISTFTSYMFDRNILSPAAAFRFTAPGVDKSLRQSIRSGDIVSIYCFDEDEKKIPLATGFIDETDTHVTPRSIEYVLTGRDTLGQLVDNDSVDSSNARIYTTSLPLLEIAKLMVKNTRLDPNVIGQQIPNASFLLQTNPGETKATALQRYLEFANCLMWSDPAGRLIVGKPNFKKASSGKLILKSDSLSNNCLEVRVRRNTNQAIRQIVTLLQAAQDVQPTPFTINNNIRDLVKTPGVGRSVLRTFTYGQGNDVVNNLSGTGVGGSPWAIGNQFSQREIARENMKVLDVEVVVRGHLNNNGGIFNIDQIYDCEFEDDTVNEPLYVYACSYELTVEHGMLTRLRLCKINTICATSEQI